MKLCMPVVESNGMNSIVFGHFGSAPFFAVYDTETEKLSLVNNNESEHEHGKCMPVDALSKLGAGAVLCKGMGLRAVNLLAAAGIGAFLVEGVTVAEAVAEFTDRKARVLDANGACQHHGCH
jgi:predicted Fe-Mo cluster-binding NifX family protein